MEQRMNVINKFNILLLIILITLPYSISAQKLHEERIYEPLIIKGEVLEPFYEIPLDEIYLYSFNSAAKTWQMMPFQIDERVYTEDPFHPGDEQAKQSFYFLPDDNVLDSDDELVFMLRDMGDKAPESNWIQDESSKIYNRLEIQAKDEKSSYAYLYRSNTITDKIPTPYEFNFDPEHHIAETKNYSVRFSTENGMLEDVKIKQPFGSNIDFFDTVKFRFVGVFSFGLFTFSIGKHGISAANERDNLHVYEYLRYTSKPVVRLIRQVRQTIKFSGVPLDATAFYLRSMHYPFSTTVKGGGSLDPDKLKEDFYLSDDILVQMELLRQSWDFNQAAAGMKFFNKYNSDININGNLDELNKTIDIPIKEWMLTAGEHGSLFSHVGFIDTSWKKIELYYYDNNQGGQADNTLIEGGDTGDSVSYGDQGIIFKNSKSNSIDLHLGFNAYFLPKNLSRSTGEQIEDWIINPVQLSSSITSYVDVKDFNTTDSPKNYILHPNYPNPFNNSTKISFEIKKTENVILEILDINGRVIKTIINKNLTAGEHSFNWNGTNNQHQIAASGIYLYRLNYTKSKKLLLIH